MMYHAAGFEVPKYRRKKSRSPETHYITMVLKRIVFITKSMLNRKKVNP